MHSSHLVSAVLVVATSLVVGWTMLVIGLIFAVLWFFAVRLGRRVDALRTDSPTDAA